MINDKAKAAATGGWLKIGIGAVVLVALMVAFLLLPIKDWIQYAIDVLKEYGAAGLVVIAIAYVPACILMVPGSALTLGAGVVGTALFPDNAFLAVATGTLAVSIGSVAGATAAFLLGRTFARDFISKRIAGNAKFSAMDEAIGNEGLKMTFLVRLSPAFPFNLLNYAMGLTKVSLHNYILGSWAGMLPGTIMYVYFGAAAAKIADTASGGMEEQGLLRFLPLLIGGIATVALVLLVTKRAKKALDEATTAPPTETA